MLRYLLHICANVLLVSICGATRCYAQTPPATGGPFRQGFEHLTMEQGLSSNSLLSMLVDGKGYLWVGTDNGLNRYDGYGFVTYKFDPRDSLSLNQNHVFTIFEDPRENLWVATTEGGISRFDRNTEKFIPYKPPQPRDRIEPVLRAVSAINVDHAGFFWIGSHSGELRRFDPRTGQFTAFDYDLGYRPEVNDLRSIDCINRIYTDRRHDLWVANGSGLHRLALHPGKPFDRGTASFRDYVWDPRDSTALQGQVVFDICEDHAGVFWVTTDRGLCSLDRATGRFVHYPWRYSMGRIVEDSVNNLWICTETGLDRLDAQRRSIDHFMPNSGDISAVCKEPIVLAVGRAGEIWVGGAGVSRFCDHQVPLAWYKHDPKDPASLLAGQVSCVFEDHRGTAWFAVDSGLDALDKKTGRFRHYRHDAADGKSLAASQVSYVLEDDEGKLWVSTWLGTLDRLDPATGIFTHYIGPNGHFLSTERRYYKCLFQDSTGVIWIGETSSGITRLDYHSGIVRHYGHMQNSATGISDYEATSLCSDDSGGLWIGHGSVATDRLDRRTGRFTHYTYHFGDTNGISGNYIQCIIRDSHGLLWFATVDGGLCCYHPAKGVFTTYTEKDGLRDNNINSVLEDDNGYIWLGTARGLCRFSPRDGRFMPFDLLNSPRNDRSATLLGKGRDGVIYCNVRDDGVKAFYPTRIPPDNLVPPVVLTRFRVFDKPIAFGEGARNIKLSYDQNFVSLEYSALNFTDILHNQYEYRLGGWDKDWVRAGDRHTVTFDRLTPGSYTFHVRASNSNGLWNEETTPVTLLIRPPWWQSTIAKFVFYIALILLIPLMIFRFHRRTVKREQQRSREKEFEMQALRAQMNPHFIFNSLTSINKFILTNDTTSASDYLIRFSRLIRMVLQHSKQALIPLEDELAMLRLYLELEKLRFKRAFDYEIDVSDDCCGSGFLLPPLILQPFVENAIWHGLMHKTGPGRLHICIKSMEDLIVISITDNGVGRGYAETVSSKSAEKQKSMGIAITRQRLALTNGGDTTDKDVVIEDLYDPKGNSAGTRVTIRIKKQSIC